MYSKAPTESSRSSPVYYSACRVSFDLPSYLERSKETLRAEYRVPVHMNGVKRKKILLCSIIHPHVHEKTFLLSRVASVTSCSATFWKSLLFGANFWQHNIPVIKKYADTSFVCHIDNDQERTKLKGLSHNASSLKGNASSVVLCCNCDKTRLYS